MTDCNATTTTFDPDTGDIGHRCGLQPDHANPRHVCFYCGRGWAATTA